MSTDPMTRRDLDGLKELITQRFDTVDGHFSRLNGRMTKAEDSINTLEKDVAVLQAQGSSDPLARWGAGLGSLLAGLLGWWK